MITAAIEADEDRDIIMIDISNAFVQIEIENKEERVMMMMQVNIEPDVYKKNNHRSKVQET
jgi:hypothetical protein